MTRKRTKRTYKPMPKRTHGFIYRIVNKITGERYIGQTVCPKIRQNDHYRDMRNNRHDNYKLQKAWKQFGEDALVFEVLCESRVEDLNEIEERLINNDPRPEYNIALSATQPMLGRHHSEKTRQEQSLRTRGKNAYWYGKKMPQEAVEKSRRANLGRVNSPESRKRVADANRGRKHTPEAKAKISATKTGMKASPETVAKMKARERSEKEVESIRQAAKPRRKQVDRICIQTGEVREYDSYMDAVRDGFDRSALNKALRGKIKSHRNYFWYYPDAKPVIVSPVRPEVREAAREKKRHKMKPVERICVKTGHTVSYASVADAQKDGYNGSNISGSIKRGGTAYGARWRWLSAKSENNPK